MELFIVLRISWYACMGSQWYDHAVGEQKYSEKMFIIATGTISRPKDTFVLLPQSDDHIIHLQ